MGEERSEMAEFGKRARAIRETRRLTIAELSERAQVDVGVLYLMENQGRIPTLGSIIKVCRALQVSADYLLGLSEFSQPNRTVAARMVAGWSQLSAKEQDMLLKMCEVLLGEQRGGQGEREFRKILPTDDLP